MATKENSSDGPIKVSKRIEKELHQTKVVVRRLPPDFTEEKLLETLTDVPNYSYFYFVAGDPTLGNFTCSRAYFAFTNESSILSFRDKYDGLQLESEKGLKYRVVIEFAPYQGIPKKTKKKLDSRIATIEQDADYQAFLQSLEGKTTQPPTMAELAVYIDSIESNKIPTVQKTPLVEFLMENHKKSVRPGRRSKSAVDSKKKRGKETPKEPHSKDEDVSRSDKDSKKKKERKEKSEKKKEKETRSPSSSSGITGSSSLASLEERHFGKDQERGGAYKEKRGRGHHEENGEVKIEDRKSKEVRTKNKDRPDQPIYSPRGKSHVHDRSENGGSKESGRSREKDGGSYRNTSKSNDGFSEYGRSSRGKEHITDEKPHRNRGGWSDIGGGKERRHEGGRRDGYQATAKDSYYERNKNQSTGSGF